MLLTLLVVWASASVPLAVGQDPGPPVPPCEAPEWVTKKSWSDESFHVVRAIEASEDNATALERALLVAVRELLTSPAGLTRDLTDVLADLGMAGPPGADPVAAFEVAPTADEKKVIECVCGENKILQQHWYDSCNRKMWVHVWGTFDAVKAAAADLVTFSDLDLALEKTLQFLAGQVSPDKHRLIVYTVVQKKVAGKTGEYLRTRVETVAAGKRFFTVVQVNALEDVLKEERKELSQLHSGNRRLQERVAKATDFIMVGDYQVTDKLVVVELKILDAYGTLLAAKPLQTFTTKMPADALDMPAEEAAGRTRVEVMTQQVADLEQQYEAQVAQAWQANSQSARPEDYQAWLEGESKDSPLTARGWTDRGCGGTYHAGEEMVFHVRCSRDCYVKLYHMSAEGELQLIYPNAWEGDNRLSARQEHRVCDKVSSCKFTVVEPFGVEMITLIASEQQFEDMDQVRQEIGVDVAGYGKPDGPAFRKLVTRGLPKGAKGVSFAVQQCAFSVVPAEK